MPAPVLGTGGGPFGVVRGDAVGVLEGVGVGVGVGVDVGVGRGVGVGVDCPGITHPFARMARPAALSFRLTTSLPSPSDASIMMSPHLMCCAFSDGFHTGPV